MDRNYLLLYEYYDGEGFMFFDTEKELIEYVIENGDSITVVNAFDLSQAKVIII